MTRALLVAIIFILIWLAPILWVAIDSSNRKLSPVFWTIVVLLSGVLGLIGYGIVRELIIQQKSGGTGFPWSG